MEVDVARDVAEYDRMVTELQKQIAEHEETLYSGLPAGHVHCATLAVDTLRQAIAHSRQDGGIGPE